MLGQMLCRCTRIIIRTIISPQPSAFWKAWKNSTEMASKALFNGSDSIITLLTKMMKDGKLIEGSSEGNKGEEITGDERKAFIERSFYTFVIPQVYLRGIILLKAIGGNPAPSRLYHNYIILT